jgi:hypothetical protein
MSRNKAKGKRQKAKVIMLLLVFSFALYSYAQDSYIYDAKGKRNPFIPLVTSDGRLLKLDKEAEPQGDLAIEGIIYDQAGRSFAIVNGQVVGVGDTAGNNYQVLKIDCDRVIFIKDGQVRAVDFKNKEGS